MAITSEAKIPKAVTATTASFDIAPISATEDAGAKTWFSARRATIDAPAFNVSGTIATASGTSTVTASVTGGFTNVRVGDAISLASGNTSGAALTATTVATKPNNNTITLTAPASNDGSGASTLAINPPSLTPTLYAIEEKLVSNGGSMNVEIRVYKYNGSLQGTNGTSSNATSSELVGTAVLDLSTFMSNLRVLPSNTDTVDLTP